MSLERLDELRRVIDGLDPAGSPRAAILRRAPEGVRGPGGVLGVMSASFNPPTRAHLRMTEEAGRLCGFDEVLFLLARTNVEKGLYGAPLEARLLMMEALAGPRPSCSVAAVSHPRFVDKAAALMPLYPAGADICFIVGYDTLVRLFDPRYYVDMADELEKLFARVRFVSANRGEHTPEAVRRFLERPECRGFADRIRVMELDARHAGMSSSEVRERLRRGEAVADLVPEEVEGLIRRMGLYREGVGGE
ncbi:nicotinate-nicotinamide nucleotide adenylyltransferase [bacterium]|nr:nicotinate-nicotinamide nucleotide adenylyltransferase [bacterium]